MVYLDPKLDEADNEFSILRSFLFKPNAKTFKIGASAHHWLPGFRYDGKAVARHFDGWQLIDLHHFRIGLKVEFQRSNKDFFQPELIILTSGSQIVE